MNKSVKRILRGCGHVVLVSFVLIGLSCYNANAKDYYFSSVNGDDIDHSGDSPDSPWKSISKLQSIVNSLNAGDVVYFERGSEWDMSRIKIEGVNGTGSNYVVFKAYGTGAQPILSGKKTITGFSQSGNIWTVTDWDFSDNKAMRVIPGLFIDGKWYPVSRTPNEGYYTTNTTDTKLYIEDYDHSWSTDEFDGGTVVARTAAWQWDKGLISGNSSGKIEIWSPGFMYTLKHSPTSYFIQNHVNCMDQNGEWAYSFSQNKLDVYYSSDLNARDVKFTAVDTIIAIENSSYLRFENIHFTGANMYAFNFDGGSNFVIDNCTFDYIGKSALKSKHADNFYFNNNDVSKVFRNGVMFNYNGTTQIKGNRFDSIGVVPGHETESEFANQAISYFRQQGEIRISRNEITNVVYGICGFENMAPIYVEENLVLNYGLQLGDGGAYYNAHDSFPVPKYIRKNIAINGTGDPDTYYNNMGMIHAYYHDYDCRNFTVDSNSAYYTNKALQSNKASNCKFRYNNIYRTGQLMNKDWRYSFYQDNHIGVTYFNNIEIKHNQIVLDDLESQYVYAPHDLFDKRENDYDYNTIITPFFDREDLFRKVSYWTPGETYDLESWAEYIGHESHSKLVKDIKYNSDMGISKDNFVKFLYNFSENDTYQPLDGRYRDKDGNIYEGQVLVPAFYSVILFYDGESDISNRIPVINDQDFIVDEDDPFQFLVGNISASPGDADQSLTYYIVSGNSQGLFTITSGGELKFSRSDVEFSGSPEYNLVVRVTDNGSPNLSAEATVSVQLQSSDGGSQLIVNNAPKIAPQSFNGSYDLNLPAVLGTVEASDPDDGQSLSYKIISGNADNHFTLDDETGAITMNSFPFNQVPATFNIIVQVTDNGSNNLSAEANITVFLLASEKVYYIDPDKSKSALEDGSYEHPFKSWSQVTWEDDASYLQKRGTVSDEDKILIQAKNVTIGDYGSGAKPVINSHANDYAIKALDKNDIAIRNLNIKAESAIGCVYFIGELCVNNTLENCELEGADYGLRMIDGNSYTVKYNVFNNKVDGIYSIAENAEIFYNVFKGNHKAINLSSYSANAKIYNNVFYDNRQGISASYAEVTLFNNIFYMTEIGDQAINHKLDKLVSNNNIFYPEQTGFIEIEEVQYNKLSDFQYEKGLDVRSLANDPLFVDVYSNNFSVTEESHAIDAGKLVGLTQDFYGKTVPFGGAPDIGLAEADASGPLALLGDFYSSNESKSELMVYPNPSSGRFNLTFENVDNTEADVRILTMSGAVIYDETFQFNGLLFSEVDLSAYPEGVYIITLETATGNHTQKLIIE